MVTGACRADAALLVFDAHEAVMENSRRHGFMLSALGIRQIAILNRIHLWSTEWVFADLVRVYAAFLERLGVKASRFIPASRQLEIISLRVREAALGTKGRPSLRPSRNSTASRL